MSSITYVTSSGNKITVEVPDRTSVMQAAVSHGVPGIVGECGGSLMCATCHVFVDPAYEHLPERASEEENEMLDATAVAREANSRLGCQIHVGREIDTLVVHIPESQY